MLKKFFAAILLAIVTILSSQAISTSRAEANAIFINDYYAFSDNGIDYYIHYLDDHGEYSELRSGPKSFVVYLKGVRNGKIVEGAHTKYTFNGDGTYDMSSGLMGNERGYVSEDSRASAIFNAVKLNKLEKDLTNIQARYDRAHELFYSQMYSQAIPHYEKLLEQFVVQGNPKQWFEYTGKAYTEMGICYAELDNLTKAKECYDKAKTVPIKSYDDYGYYYYGLLCEKLKLYDDALHNYDIALQKTYQGSLLRGDISKAQQRVKQLKKNVKVATPRDNSIIAQGDALFKEKRYEEAIKVYRTALENKNDPYIHEVYFKIALSYRKLKNYNRAIFNIDEAIKIAKTKLEYTSDKNHAYQLNLFLQECINRKRGWVGNQLSRAI